MSSAPRRVKTTKKIIVSEKPEQDDEESLDIFVSIHVSSQGGSAKVLSQYFRDLGLKVWVCTESLDAGDAFRDEIVRAVKSCKVFLPLINAQWASSGECKDEYSLAKRLNLTSLERGVTAANEPRRPVMIPVSFPNLTWDAHPHVELLAASTNFIVHNADVISPSDTRVLHSLVRGLNGVGFNISVPGLDDADAASPGPSSTSTRLPPSDPRMLAASVMQMVDQQQNAMRALMTSLSRLGNSSGDNKMSHQGEADIVYPEDELGTQGGLPGIDGTDSFEFELEKGEIKDDILSVSGICTWRRIYVNNRSGPTYDAWASQIALSVRENLCAKESLAGTLNLKSGLLTLKGKPLSRDKGADFEMKHTLYLLLNHDGTMLSGSYHVSNQAGSMRARGF